jgi:VIT1/CCC1 family predicted Fe2+/Mn2+ transporter
MESRSNADGKWWKLSHDDVSTAVFGGWDGDIGALAVLISTRHAPIDTLLLAGAGAAIGNTFSMASGQYESMDATQPRLRAAIIMFVAALLGGLLPIIPFFSGSVTIGLIFGIIASFGLATAAWIVKREGWRGALRAYALLSATVLATIALSFG